MPEKTKILVSFKSKQQAPWLMITKLFYQSDEICWGKVLFEFWPTRTRWLKAGLKKLGYCQRQGGRDTTTHRPVPVIRRVHLDSKKLRPGS